MLNCGVEGAWGEGEERGWVAGKKRTLDIEEMMALLLIVGRKRDTRERRR